MSKCDKCGSVISDNDVIAWKCNKCGKVFKVTLSGLKQVQIQKDKPGNAGKILLKCHACGGYMDDGNEKIACKCSACSNIMIRNLKEITVSEKDHVENRIKNEERNIITQENTHKNKRLKIAGFFLSVMIVFAAVMSNNIKTDEKYEYDNQERQSNSNISAQSKTIEHYCEAGGCYKEGTRSVTGFSGKAEYYCYDHYKEMQDNINMIEKDVGSSSESKHQCEECTKEGIREIVGLSGETEYYCTEHYNEMIEIINMLIGE